MRYVRYLAYGSNLHPPRIRQRIADLKIVETVALPGWSLRFHKIGRDGSGKCNLIQSDDGLAYGAVYEIEIQGKTTLDRIEGLGRGYEEQRLILDDVGTVYFYRATDDHIDDALKPYDWYKAFVLAGLRHHGMPADYIRTIEVVPAVADQDADRASFNRSVLLASFD
jgi:hypothetical protein